MESILKKITDRIRETEALSFEGFDPAGFRLKQRPAPIDIMTLLEKNFFVIAEVKKGSPSKGIIRENFDPKAIAHGYEAGNASAISVITEQHFFHGDKNHLTVVKEAVQLPVLRKDFLVHPYQVYESYNLGADFVLLIAACLTDQELNTMYGAVRSLGMEALVEVHDEEEIKRIARMSPRPNLIGINNRNLKTFTVDIETSFQLLKAAPPGVHVISESGIRSPEDIHRLKTAGFSGALIGESLLRQKDVTAALRRLTND